MKIAKRYGKNLSAIEYLDSFSFDLSLNNLSNVNNPF